jgi:hypothetical protein
VTADGSVIVGSLYLADEQLARRADVAAGIWSEEIGRMVPLQDVLVSDYGLDQSLEGYHLTIVRDITDDGRFMVGNSINPAGLSEAWLVDLGPSVLLPGDYNDNGTVEQADLDLLGIEIAAGTNNVVFDVNGDQLVNAADRDVFLGGDLISSGNKLNGDAEFDGQVQFADFVILSSNFGKSGVWSQGDFDVDGVVQFGDFVILSNNFGQSVAAAAAVPEPATTTLLSLTCLVGVVAFGRRRCSHTSKDRRSFFAAMT